MIPNTLDVVREQKVLTVASRLDKKAMIKKINPSPKINFTSFELSEFRRGRESL